MPAIRGWSLAGIFIDYELPIMMGVTGMVIRF